MIDGETKIAAVLGYPALHSQSPTMHNAAFKHTNINAAFLALNTPPESLWDVVASLAAVGALGASVTLPHKTSVMNACTSLSPEAEAIGAVNCLEFSKGAIIGHNTDGVGYTDSLKEAGVNLKNNKAVLLGSGGAARAVHWALCQQGANVTIMARTPTGIDWGNAKPWTNTHLSTELSTCDLLVDCTTIGLSRESEKNVTVPVPLDALPDHATFSSLIYHRETEMMRSAQKKNLLLVDGAGMLLHQGARAYEIWTGQNAPVEIMRTALLSH